MNEKLLKLINDYKIQMKKVEILINELNIYYRKKILSGEHENN